jgi:hypothetical protein
MRARALVRLLPLLLLGACTQLGPRSIPGDRLEFSRALADSWKQQALLNIVKFRYLDPPIFVDVGQIVSGYTMESTVSAGVAASHDSPDVLTLGAAGRYTDRPTITYTPLTGPRFVRGLMTPLPPETLLFLIQSGWPADWILRLSLESINGLRNHAGYQARGTPGDARFFRLLALLRQIQVSSALRSRVETDTLGIDEFRVVHGAAPTKDDQLALETRSVYHILAALGACVEVPPEDVDQGRATPAIADDNSDDPARVPLLRVHRASARPKEAFVAVPYHGSWYWIDDRDLASKRTFAFVLLLFTLADNGPEGGVPVLTIPTG